MANHIGKIPLGPLNALDHLEPAWLSLVILNRGGSGWIGTNGAKGTFTDTQPIIEEAKVAHVGKKPLSFGDDFYNRILIEPSYIDIGNLVSEQFYLVNVFNGYFESKVLGSLSVQNGEGLFINGPLAGDSWGPLETKAYQVTISADGPPSIAAKLQFDWPGADDDIEVVIVGSRVVMLPYQAEAPWGESLEWKTDLLTSNNGTEQRIRLRKSARQYFKATFPIKPDQLQRAYNMAYGWVSKRWAVGVWSETQAVGTVASGSVSLDCNTFNYDFRAKGLICLWESEYKNDIIEIESVEAGKLILKRELANNYTNATLLPVRMAMALNGSIQRVSNGYSSALGVEYVVTDNIQIPSDVPEQFLGSDIYYDESLMGDEGGLSDAMKVRLDSVDYDTGAIDYFSPWTYTKRLRAVGFLNDGASECWTFKKWLNRRAGRLRPYWLPTFENNLRLNQTGLVGTTLFCEPDDYRNIGKDHTHIAVQLDDNSWLPRTIIGSANNGALISISIDNALYVDATRINRICFLTYNRLDADKIDINWIGNHINQCSLNILEIKP